MSGIDLQSARSGACELLTWSHAVLEYAHGQSGPGDVSDLLRKISANIGDVAKRIENASPLIDSVATASTLADVPGVSMHDVALELANRIRQTASNVLFQVLSDSGPDGTELTKIPSWNDIPDYWPQVRRELLIFPKFDLVSACDAVGKEAERAIAAFSTLTSNESAPRPPWYKALKRLGDQFSTAAKQHLLISCEMAHADTTHQKRLPTDVDRPNRTALETFGGVYRLGRTPCRDPRDVPFAVALASDAATRNSQSDDAQLVLRMAFRHVSLFHKNHLPNRQAADEAWSKYRALASQAGRTIRDIPTILLANVTGQALKERNDDHRWLWVVFDLAWYDGRGGLSAPRQIVLRKGGGKMSYPYDLKSIRQLAQQHAEVEIPPEWSEKLPEYWESELEDVFSASATAIDLIIANVDAYFIAAIRELAGDTPKAPVSGDATPATAHSPDFRAVKWFGGDFSFTASQAAAIAVLWRAWAQGTPDVGDETILSAVDEEAPPRRLNVLFRDHPAWKSMIVPGATKGTHRLKESV